MCYNIKFGSSASKGLWINRRNPKMRSVGVPPPCGRGVTNPLEIRPSPTRVILPSFVVLRQTVPALLRRSAWKFDSSRPAFQGHSRLSVATRIDSPPTYDFPLTLHSNHGPTPTVSARWTTVENRSIFPHSCMRRRWRC